MINPLTATNPEYKLWEARFRVVQAELSLIEGLHATDRDIMLEDWIKNNPAPEPQYRQGL